MTTAPTRRRDERIVAWGLLVVSLAATFGVFVLNDAGGGPRAAMMTVAFAALAAVLVDPRRVGALSLRAVVVVSLLAGVAAIVPAPLESTDVWSYSMYGRMVAEYDASPYTHVPNDFPDDPFKDRIGPRWHDTPSMYGPGFTVVSGGFMRVAGEDPGVARVLFQLFTLAGFALVVLLVARATGAAGAVVAIGLNPLILYSVVNSAHYDIVIGACLLGAVFLAVRQRDLGAGALVALAVTLKLTAGLAAPALVFWVWYKRGFARACATGAVCAGLIVTALAVVGRFDMFDALSSARGLIGLASFWHAIAPDGLASLPEGSAASLGGTAATVALVTTTAVSLWLGFTRRRDATPAFAIAGAMVAYLLCSPYVVPWYAAAVLPVLALSWRSGMSVLIAAQSAVFTIAYQLERSHSDGVVLWVLAVAIALVNLSAVVVLVVAGWRRERAAGRGGMLWVEGDSNPRPRG